MTCPIREGPDDVQAVPGLEFFAALAFHPVGPAEVPNLDPEPPRSENEAEGHSGVRVTGGGVFDGVGHQLGDDEQRVFAHGVSVQSCTGELPGDGNHRRNAR